MGYDGHRIDCTLGTYILIEEPQDNLFLHTVLLNLLPRIKSRFLEAPSPFLWQNNRKEFFSREMT